MNVAFARDERTARGKLTPQPRGILCIRQYIDLVEPLANDGLQAGIPARDVTLGVDLIKGPRSVETAIGDLPFAASRAVVRISAVEVYAYPSIDDGGFDYVGEHP